jgi:hypothetical protein
MHRCARMPDTQQGRACSTPVRRQCQPETWPHVVPCSESGIPSHTLRPHSTCRSAQHRRLLRRLARQSPAQCRSMPRSPGRCDPPAARQTTLPSCDHSSRVSPGGNGEDGGHGSTRTNGETENRRNDAEVGNAHVTFTVNRARREANRRRRRGRHACFNRRRRVREERGFVPRRGLKGPRAHFLLRCRVVQGRQRRTLPRKCGVAILTCQ